MLHKLRRAMVRPGRDRLAGEIEVDETFLGPQAPGTLGRGGRKTIVAIAVEARPRGACGRARLARIADCSEPVLSEFVATAAEHGSVVSTDSWRGYLGLERAGFTHWPTSISASGDPAHVLMPRAHRIASLLKRWLLGTHQGATRAKQLDFYLDEFTFRFTAAARTTVGCSSTGSSSRPFSSNTSPSRRSSAAVRFNSNHEGERSG